MGEHIYRYTPPRKEYVRLSTEYHQMKYSGSHCRSFVEAIRDALKALEEDEARLEGDLNTDPAEEPPYA
jgi:hypothetical protein